MYKDICYNYKMSYLTRNIVDFYKPDQEHLYYLKRYFTNTDHFGLFEPYAKNPVMREADAIAAGGDYIATIDDHNTYEINAFGLRGEIYKNPDVIAGGCSITFGLGVPEKGRWTNILGNTINKNIMNLATPGASVESVCNTIIQYSMNNTMPKEIFCLMPDFFRRMVVVDKEFYKTKASKNSFAEGQDYLALLYCNPIVYPANNGVFMEVTNKKYIEDSISPHQLIMNSINAIYMLESFCSSNNIKLYWTTWDMSSHLVMEELLKVENFKLKKYIPFFQKDVERFSDIFKNDDLVLCSKSEFSSLKSWSQGTDYAMINKKKVESTSHPGVHFHFHLSELFHNSYKQDIS